MIRLLSIHFDAGEELATATFEIDEPVQALIIESLGSFTPAYRRARSISGNATPGSPGVPTRPVTSRGICDGPRNDDQ